MKEIQITDKMLRYCKKKAHDLGTLNNSILKGDGNLTGFLGEVVAWAYFRQDYEVEEANTYDYDLIVDGKTVDVKTKLTTVAPQSYYECSVAEFNTKQRCDYYCFVRIKSDLKTGWVLGVYPKQKYYEDAKYLKKGQVDGDNGFIVKSNCYNMPISSLGFSID